MTAWPNHPVIYEINTWVWLHDLSQQHSRALTLATVPAQEWDALAMPGVDAVWLMGVWERSPAGTIIAREHKALQRDYRRALPDYAPQDVVGSPYCVRRYIADPHLGGPEGLTAARQALKQRGLHLLLDFVPNHVAPDHPWIMEHPAYFIQGDEADLARAPDEFFRAGEHIIAHGRDPHFPPWTDTAQLNAFHPALRQAVVETLRDIADLCDGVRCDMAMLLVSRIFAHTWQGRVEDGPRQEFWWQVIRAVRETNPDFLFLAEAYWDMEWELQQQGFDYCYDKRLYDRLAHESAESVRLHLLADLSYQGRLVRFIENHDEPRAAMTFGSGRSRVAALTAATLPGARLFHDGQFEGRRVRLPVQLGRRPTEEVNVDLRAFYRTLLEALSAPVFHEGDWRLCERNGWPDNDNYRHLVAWCWRQGDERRLVVVNLSAWGAQGHVRLPWEDLAGRSWRLCDLLSGDVYHRDGDAMLAPGLYVGLPPWGYHFFRFERA